MNDPNKAIDVNLSSLLSLKAELLRKQAEVNRAKASRSTRDEYVSSNTNRGCLSAAATDVSNSKRDQRQHVTKVSSQNDAKIYEHEDTELLEKSQRVLVAKSKFYERMTRAGGALNTDDNCLVLFNRKRQEESSPEHERKSLQSYDSSDSSEDEESADPEEDWVEYNDCLGRSRKCLRKDLQDAKRRDAELASSMPERLDQSKPNWMIDTKGGTTDDDESDAPIGPLPPESIGNDVCSLMSKHDEQRANWERKEIENFDKPDVHYQDVFFDEARQHGVGYYAFSTDEDERKRQQLELEEARKKTIEEQHHRDTLRAQREKIIAERVRAAKNRQRARLGLPPLEESDDQVKNAEAAEDIPPTKEERKQIKREEKRKRKEEKLKMERELERQQHIRPWDREKKGLNVDTKDTTVETESEWSYKAERLLMSQEQWNEQKRGERKLEFAPIPEMDSKPSKPKRTNFNSMPPPRPPPVDAFVSVQSTKSEKKQFQKRNFSSSNKADDSESSSSKGGGGGAAIPPPTDLYTDYTLPSNAKKSKTNVELERSIEAGLRFLRDNCDKGTQSTKSSWTAKADY